MGKKISIFVLLFVLAAGITFFIAAENNSKEANEEAATTDTIVDTPEAAEIEDEEDTDDDEELIEADTETTIGLESSVATKGDILTNGTYGFSVGVPDGLVHLPNQSNDDIYTYFGSTETIEAMTMTDEELWVTIAVRDNSSDLTLEEIAASTPGSGDDAVIRDITSLTVAGFPAIQQIEDSTEAIDTETSYAVVTYVENGGLVYSLGALTRTETGFTLNSDMYDYMVDNFKFLD